MMSGALAANAFYEEESSLLSSTMYNYGSLNELMIYYLISLLESKSAVSTSLRAGPI